MYAYLIAALALMTCENIQVLGSAASNLTAEQLQDIFTEEFSDCIASLGMIRRWSSEQLEVLLRKVETASLITQILKLIFS